jgi:hypothetical protein
VSAGAFNLELVTIDRALGFLAVAAGHDDQSTHIWNVPPAPAANKRLQQEGRALTVKSEI